MQQPYYSQIPPSSSGPNPLLIGGILLLLVVIGVVIYFVFFPVAATGTSTSTATHTSTGTATSTATHTSTSTATHTSTATATHTSTGTGTGVALAWPRHFHGSSGGIVLDMTVQKVNLTYTFTGTMDESDGPFNISGTLLGASDPRTYTINAPSSTQFPISLNSTVLSSTQVITLKIPFLTNTYVCCFVDGSTVNSCPSI